MKAQELSFKEFEALIAGTKPAPKSNKGQADWDLVCDFCHFSGKRRGELDERTKRLLDSAVWAKQDGYGSPGYTPCQGWDWSGIRDSSKKAVREMAKAVRRTLKACGYSTK